MVLPIVRPQFPELDIIKDKFNRCLYQGNVTNGGEYVRRFENKIEEYIGAPTLCFNNGQTALIAMLLAAGVKENDGVLMPSFTFCGTAAAVSMIGAIPVFCDIDYDTLTMSPLHAADQMDDVYPDIEFILGVDVYGICCNYPELQKLADKYEAKLLLDSAPAFGAMFGSFPTGRHGHAQIFSFHATKPFSTMEGGCLCTRSPEIYEKAKRIRDFGQNDNKECVEIGLNGKMMEICALIGLENLRDWRERRHQRTMKGWDYRPKLKQVEGVTIIHEHPEPAQWPIWAYQPILIEPEFGLGRDEVIAGLYRRGVMARKYYAPPCHQMKPYANGQTLPVTEEVASKVIALPFYSDMRIDEMDYIAESLKEIQANGRRGTDNSAAMASGT